MANVDERGGAQPIPRPDGWEPGDPSPWAHLSPEERHVDLDRILRALRTGPPPVRLSEADGGPPSSAVLVPLFEEDGKAWIVLTRRAQHLRRHRGEVSFPGGRQDPGEALVDTAKREAFEEIGLDPDSVEIVGELDQLRTVAGRAAIAPFVGVLPGRPLDLVPNPDEVELILTLPFDELLHDDTYHQEVWRRPEIPKPMPFFDVVGDTIWGATAFMLHDFLSRVLATP